MVHVQFVGSRSQTRKFRLLLAGAHSSGCPSVEHKPTREFCVIAPYARAVARKTVNDKSSERQFRVSATDACLHCLAAIGYRPKARRCLRCAGWFYNAPIDYSHKSSAWKLGVCHPGAFVFHGETAA